MSNILDPVLNFLLPLGPFWVILIISLFISVLTTIVYKYTTDQEKLKRLKADLKRYQKKAAALKSEPEKAVKVQKDMMKLNGQYMKSSLKSTLYTFLPIIIFFGWLAAHFAFMPLLPDTAFNVSVTVQEGVSGNMTLVLPSGITIDDVLVKEINGTVVYWEGIKGSLGPHEFSVVHSDGDETFFSVLISDEYIYEDPLIKVDDSPIFKSILLGNEKLKVFEDVQPFKSIPWVKNWGWIGAYLVFSLLFSTSLRKILKLA